MTQTIRQPAVAGSFYPAAEPALRHALDEAFAQARRPAPDAAAPKALVVPHAGYMYSGPIAASAYLRLAPARDIIRRVVLLGPTHRFPLDGMAVPRATAFATPLGIVAIDPTVPPGVLVDDRPHADEHSLEVQLPFLQTVLDDFTLLPVAVGWCEADDVAAVLDAVWGGPETVVVVSTDLSHYHRYDEAMAIDQRTVAAIAAAQPDRIADTDACGAYGLRGLLTTAQAKHLDVEVIDVRNSGDTAGDRDRVVGYGAFALV